MFINTSNLWRKRKHIVMTSLLEAGASNMYLALIVGRGIHTLDTLYRPGSMLTRHRRLDDARHQTVADLRTESGGGDDSRYAHGALPGAHHVVDDADSTGHGGRLGTLVSGLTHDVGTGGVMRFLVVLSGRVNGTARVALGFLLATVRVVVHARTHSVDVHSSATRVTGHLLC